MNLLTKIKNYVLSALHLQSSLISGDVKFSAPPKVITAYLVDDNEGVGFYKLSKYISVNKLDLYLQLESSNGKIEWILFRSKQFNHIMEFPPHILKCYGVNKDCEFYVVGSSIYYEGKHVLALLQSTSSDFKYVDLADTANIIVVDKNGNY